MSLQTVKSLYMSYAGGTLGTRVFRATSVAPANTWEIIFTVSGGLVLMTMLVGETTAADTSAASNLDIQIDPTGLAAVSFCAVTAIDSDAIGTIYTFTGNPADPCYAAFAVPGGMAGGALATGQNMHGWIIPPGNIEWRETDLTPDHAVQWTMFYVPIDREASVAAGA